MLRPTHIEIDRARLKKNLALLKAWTGQGFFCPMVKANAYGHDEEIVARAIESFSQANAMGVALVEEGMRLRQVGIKSPILVFAPFDKIGAETMQEFQLTPVVGRFEDLDALVSGNSKNVPSSIHLKFNTGMQRLGFDRGDLPQLRTRLNSIHGLTVAGVCTHLTHGDEATNGNSFTSRQIALFRELSEGFPGVRHLHKSASLCVLQARAGEDDLGSRPGIAVYGLPYEGRNSGPGLLPILTWKTKLTHIHALESGATVGYGGRFKVARKSQIGVVSVGYADGYRRDYGNGQAEMLFRGRRVKVVGSVCMDYTLLDLTDALTDGSAQVGESIVIIGAQGSDEIPAVELAEKAETISYEVVTAISTRVPREAV